MTIISTAVNTLTLHSAMLLESQTRRTKKLAINTVRAVTSGLFFILGLCRWWLSASHPSCFTPGQLKRTDCGFLFLFACFWQYKCLLPLFDIELSFLAVPPCSLFTILMLPLLNSSIERTAWIFQILLIAQGSAGWRQQQLMTCCFVQAFEFGTWKLSEKICYKNVRTFTSFLCLRPNRK